jgi:Alpha/beta hydrolase domain
MAYDVRRIHMGMPVRFGACSLWRASIGAIFLAVITPGVVYAAPPPPTVVISPVSSGSRPNAFNASLDALSAHGFVEQEFFIAGNVAGRDRRDNPVENRPYKTRFLVRRPLDAARFNGTVIVEWTNAAFRYDLELGWPMLGDLIMRDGYAWIGISTMPASVEFLKAWDSQRYGTMTHPGATPPTPAGGPSTETYSDAIFAQFATVLRNPGPVDPLRGLQAQRLLAFGSALSGGRLKAFINNLQVGASPFDGFFVHAIGGGGKLRENLDVPVFHVNSEWEVPSFVANRQPDSAFFRYWEIPGSAHIARLSEDTVIAESRRDQGDIWLRRCDYGQAVVSIEYVSRAALHHLNAWVRTGKQPPHAPLASVDTSTSPPSLVLDRHGNLLGGIRLPHLEAPTGRNVGTGPPLDNNACLYTGGHAPFDTATLRSLYASHEDYVSRVNTAVQRAVEAGYLLDPDAQALRRDADRSPIGANQPR